MEMLLHADADDFLLRSTADQDRSIGLFSVLETAYLTDTNGNRLVDTEGNYITGVPEWVDAHAMILHAPADDFLVRAPTLSLELTALADDFQLTSE